MSLTALLPSIRNNTCPEINLPGGVVMASISLEEIPPLAEALKVNFSVTKINLSGNYIGDKEIECLASAFKANRSITHIDFSRNKIGNIGAKYLAEILAISRSISILRLNLNSIADEGCTYLATALITNYALSSIFLRGNPLSNTGITALVKALQTNCTLTKISITLSRGALEDFEINIDKNRSLVSIGIGMVGLSRPPIPRIRNNREIRDECHQAAQQGNQVRLQKLLIEGVSLLSVTGEDKNTLLHWAVLGNHKKMVSDLVREYQARGPLVDTIRNAKGQTPLDLAITHQYRAIAKMLLEAATWESSDHSLLTDNSSQLLQTAKEEDDTELQAERQKQWKDALSAIKTKREEYHKHDKECRDKRQKLNETAADAEGYREIEEDYKAAQRKLEEAKQALSAAEENSRQLSSELDASRSEALGYKAELDKLSQEKKKLQHKLAEINRREKSLKMEREVNIGAPLFGAIMRKDKASLEEILNEGHDVNSFTDKNGRTLLYRAVEVESIDIVKLLLERGADPDKKDDSNETPLHRSIKLQNNSYSITQLLISSGAYVDMRMKNGISTALHFAVEIFDRNLIRLLVEAGADVNIPMKGGKKLLEFLEEKIIPLNKKIKDKEREHGGGVLIGQAEEEVKAIKKELAPYEEIYKLLKEAADEKDPNAGYTKAERLIENRFGALRAKYGTAIDVQLRHPEILEEQGIPDIILSYLDNIVNDYEQIKKILDPNIPHPIPLLSIDREKFEREIEKFFKDWETKLKKADDNAKNKPPKIALSASQPTSAFSSPTSSTEH